ncbi:N-acetyl-D-Glu racemase DgcA [Xanthobacter sp. KR7-65]|uniref:N-acetyl-D-Glu racemase DgcA n=1 Tax=Xanthobacter sp. KR7-65 TaxID=3156612 RepID=UPI0032B46021
MASLTLSIQRFPIAGTFTIARGSKTEAVVVEVHITADGITGRGECVPYARYGETVDGVVAAIEALAPDIAAGMGRETLQHRMPAGAARNAIDCALWDLEAKRSGMGCAELAGLPALRPVTTAYTLSLDTPEAMARAAAAAADRPLLKLKLGAPGDRERLSAIRAAVPDARLIVDANEGWKSPDLPFLLEACAKARVELVEQPLPVDADQRLERLERPVPVCADESVHDRSGLADLRGRYDAVNVKLDKAGGLTEALALAEAAHGLGFDVMVGCMLASSLAMAPALVVAQRARWVDLDGPLLLARDRTPGLRYDGALVFPPAAELWG